MTLRQAIRIGLSHVEGVRILAASGAVDEGEVSMVIARRDASGSAWRFRAEVMALVRTIEEQYWNLSRADTQLRAAERAFTTAAEVLDRQRSEREAEQVEWLRRELDAQATDRAAAEERLRGLVEPAG